MGAVVATVSCLLALGPCTGRAPVPVPVPPVSRFAISYERGGGFAAMPQKLTVRPGRHATVTALGADGKARSAEFRIGVKQVKQLRAAAETAHLGEVAPSQPGSCADCFVYTVAYRGAEASVDEVDVPTRMRPLIDRAEALIAAHLPFH